MKAKYWILALCLSILSVPSCKKSDGFEDGNESTYHGGSVFQGQLVKVSIPDKLNGQEFVGSLGNQSIKLTQMNDTGLYFMVPYDAPAGEQLLKIEEKPELLLAYTVVETKLLKSPEETFEPMISMMEGFSETIKMDTLPAKSEVQATISNFLQIYQNASAEEKRQYALFYQANAELFDGIINDDYDDLALKNNSKDRFVLYVKCKASVLAMAGGVAVAILGVGPDKLIGVAVASIGCYKAFGHLMTFNLAPVIKTNMVLDDVDGYFKKQNELKFYEGEEKELKIEFRERGVSMEDQGSNSAPSTVGFFTTYYLYNSTVNTLNDIISWVNDNVFFADFKRMKNFQLPGTRAEEIGELAETDYTGLSFSLKSDEAAIGMVRGLGTGKYGISINSTSSSQTNLFILHYEYQDAFNEIKGFFPIELVPKCTDFDGKITVSFDGINGKMFVDVKDFPDSSTLYYNAPFQNQPGIYPNYSSVGGITISGYLKKGDTSHLILKNEKGCEKTVPFVVPDLVVGQPYQGGYIVHINGNGTSGYILADKDASSSITWCKPGSDFCDSLMYGLNDGEAGTNQLVQMMGSGSYAAKVCQDFSYGGYSDWYLPSHYEWNLVLKKMYNWNILMKPLDLYGSFWSCSPSGTTQATRDFYTQSSSGSGPISRSASIQARAMRKF